MEQYRETLWKFLSENSEELGVLKRLVIAFNLIKEVHSVLSRLLVHRDLKLTNVMLSANKELALVDFGISRNRTILMGSCGTPGFNAPEQHVQATRKRIWWTFSVLENV